MVIKGHRLIMCGSNNYLGLTTHPRVREAGDAPPSTFRHRAAPAPAFLNGTLELHEELEAGWPSGWTSPPRWSSPPGMQANLGTISALVGRGDWVFLDKDGPRQHRGRRPSGLRQDRALSPQRHGRTWREAARALPNRPACWWSWTACSAWKVIWRRCRSWRGCAGSHGARFMVDDAHGMGVIGGGRGTAAHFGLDRRSGSHHVHVQQVVRLARRVHRRRRGRDRLHQASRAFPHLQRQPHAAQHRRGPGRSAKS